MRRQTPGDENICTRLEVRIGYRSGSLPLLICSTGEGYRRSNQLIDVSPSSLYEKYNRSFNHIPWILECQLSTLDNLW
jgi:hypothetical protein